MVEHKEAEEVLEDRVALVLGNADNVLHKVRVHEHALPARDRVCANYRVHSLKVPPDVAQRAALALVQLVAKHLRDRRDVVEEARLVHSLELLKVVGKRGQQVVVHLVAAVSWSA